MKESLRQLAKTGYAIRGKLQNADLSEFWSIIEIEFVSQRSMDDVSKRLQILGVLAFSIELLVEGLHVNHHCDVPKANALNARALEYRHQTTRAGTSQSAGLARNSQGACRKSTGLAPVAPNLPSPKMLNGVARRPRRDSLMVGTGWHFNSALMMRFARDWANLCRKECRCGARLGGSLALPFAFAAAHDARPTPPSLLRPVWSATRRRPRRRGRCRSSTPRRHTAAAPSYRDAAGARTARRRPVPSKL